MYLLIKPNTNVP